MTIRRLVLLGGLMGLLFLGGLAMVQDRLLYFPERVALPTLVAEAQRDGLRPWPAAGEFRGLVREPAGQARGTLVLFHGNAGHVGHRAFYAGLTRFGMRVVLAEYPGYGPRSGALGEQALVEDATETISLARREFGGPILLAGESLGSGVAAAAYARAPDPVAALWLITPWDRLVNVASHHYPWLPVGWLLRDRYDNLSHLADVKVPVAIVIAEADVIVPARFGRHLYQQLREPKRLWSVPDAGHNDWLGRIDESGWAGIADYLRQSQRVGGDATAGNRNAPQRPVGAVR